MAEGCSSLPTLSTDKLIAFLNDHDKAAADPYCTEFAILHLDELKDQRATNVLISYLDFEHPMTDAERHGALVHLYAPYPAIGALVRIGKPAVSPLIKAIGCKDSSDLARKNAVQALMSIYRKTPAEGITMLKSASTQSNGSEEKALFDAAAISAVKWCSPTKKSDCEAALSK